MVQLMLDFGAGSGRRGAPPLRGGGYSGMLDYSIEKYNNIRIKLIKLIKLVELNRCHAITGTTEEDVQTPLSGSVHG